MFALSNNKSYAVVMPEKLRLEEDYYCQIANSERSQIIVKSTPIVLAKKIEKGMEAMKVLTIHRSLGAVKIVGGGYSRPSPRSSSFHV